MGSERLRLPVPRRLPGHRGHDAGLRRPRQRLRRPDRRAVPDRQELRRRHGRVRRGHLGLRQHADGQSPLPGDEDAERWRSATATTTTATARSTSSTASGRHAQRVAGDLTPPGAPSDVTMFAYEASHVDAGKDTSNKDIIGTDTIHRPARSPGKQPWTNVTKEEAETACEKIGDGSWRLCTAPSGCTPATGGTDQRPSPTAPPTRRRPATATTTSGRRRNPHRRGSRAPDARRRLRARGGVAPSSTTCPATSRSGRDHAGTGPLAPTRDGRSRCAAAPTTSLSFVDSSSAPGTIAPGLQCDASTAAPYATPTPTCSCLRSASAAATRARCRN